MGTETIEDVEIEVETEIEEDVEETTDSTETTKEVAEGDGTLAAQAPAVEIDYDKMAEKLLEKSRPQETTEEQEPTSWGDLSGPDELLQKAMQMQQVVEANKTAYKEKVLALIPVATDALKKEINSIVDQFTKENPTGFTQIDPNLAAQLAIGRRVMAGDYKPGQTVRSTAEPPPNGARTTLSGLSKAEMNEVNKLKAAFGFTDKEVEAHLAQGGTL